MTMKIGKTMANQTTAFRVLKDSADPCALDMGMAPGGFSSTILTYYPTTKIRAVTLSNKDGGHAVQMSRHPNVKLEFRDINTLAGDLGIETLPETHHATSMKLTTKRLFSNESYDVVICGGQVVRNQDRPASRNKLEARRLTLSQLVIAMEHIKTDGTLIAVMHKLEALSCVELLHIFSRIANEVVLFKPRKHHGNRSSFYMVALGVQPHCPAATEAVRNWKKEWEVATFEPDKHAGLTYWSMERTEKLLEEYGEKLVKLGGYLFGQSKQKR